MPDWYPGSYRPDPAYPPHYRTMPGYLRIEDDGSTELQGKRQKFWGRCLKAGLQEWSPVGLDLRIRPARLPFGANRVTVGFMDKADYNSDRPGLHCFEVCPPIVPGTTGADWILIDREAFEQFFKSNVTIELRYIIAHEFGHSLGFGHGGNGIMDETPSHAVVNAEEIAAAREYWL